MKTTVALVAAALVATVCIDPTLGKRSYLLRIPNGSKFTMILGHPSLTNRSTNAFGAQFKQLGLNWTLPLCLANYPNTTIMNGAAFGDPCCVWKMGDVPYFNVSNWTDVPTIAYKCNTTLPTLMPTNTTTAPNVTTTVTPVPTTLSPLATTATPAPTTTTVTPAPTTTTVTPAPTSTTVTPAPTTTTVKPMTTTVTPMPTTTKPVTTSPATTRPTMTTPPPTQKKTKKPTPSNPSHCNTGDESDDSEN